MFFRILYTTALLLVYGQLVYAQHSIERLPEPINTDSLDEICPVVSYDEKLLFFTRNADPDCNKTLIIDGINLYNIASKKEYSESLRMVYSQIASEYIPDPLSSGYNQDIWYTRLNNGQPYGIFHPSYPINDVLPNSICSNFGTSNSFLIINQFFPEGGIEKGFSVSEFDGESFTFPRLLHIAGFNQISSEINLTASRDSTILILAMKGGSTRNMDLFVAFRISDGRYTSPVHLGPSINSEYRESTPMLSHDMKKLYFASDRTDGYGGTDIYVSERLDLTYTNWSRPNKLDPPLNSEYDDAHPHLMNDDNTIFFTSNRNGSSDIFKAKLKRSKITIPITVNIKVIHQETGKNHPAEISWGPAYNNIKSNTFYSKNGICKYKFFENKAMVFQAANRELQSEEVIIDPQYLIENGKNVIDIELILIPQQKLIIKRTDIEQRWEAKPEHLVKETSKPAGSIKEDVENRDDMPLKIVEDIIVHNIYFERTKPELLKESYPEVLKLAGLLTANPSMNISIAGHTDNVGEKNALIKLSQDRAIAIKKILLEKGIPAYRVTALGYGDTKPLAPNDTEQNKSKNRRVEIKILASTSSR
ncbi:MAG: OmpA family protein [Saprospiraceae bacterium]|nr:OmpA family protein [Saprospiraceae bacterium]